MFIVEVSWIAASHSLYRKLISHWLKTMRGLTAREIILQESEVTAKGTSERAPCPCSVASTSTAHPTAVILAQPPQVCAYFLVIVDFPIPIFLLNQKEIRLPATTIVSFVIRAFVNESLYKQLFVIQNDRTFSRFDFWDVAVLCRYLSKRRDCNKNSECAVFTQWIKVHLIMKYFYRTTWCYPRMMQ